VNILALETTDWVGSVAAMAGDKVLLELDLNHLQRIAQSLVPGIQSLFKHLGWTADDVRLVAMTIGPGSFTGLRIGVTLAKIFTYSIGAEVLGVSTLETIAQAVSPDVPAVSVIVDAQRGDLVAQEFIRGADGFFVPAHEERMISAEQWLAELPVGMAVAGPALAKIAAILPADANILDQSYWRPRAGAVAQLARRQYAAGRRDDLWTLLPHYSRLSAAEEKRK
jgi:tRNA threonylcarbamoyladenosine biosynthesis protein TsaB